MSFYENTGSSPGFATNFSAPLLCWFLVFGSAALYPLDYCTHIAGIEAPWAWRCHSTAPDIQFKNCSRTVIWRTTVLCCCNTGRVKISARNSAMALLCLTIICGVFIATVGSCCASAFACRFWARSQDCEKQLLASSCPRGITGLQLDGFWWNLVFRRFFLLENMSRKFKFR
jgi:hypothetical protein